MDRYSVNCAEQPRRFSSPVVRGSVVERVVSWIGDLAASADKVRDSRSTWQLASRFSENNFDQLVQIMSSSYSVERRETGGPAAHLQLQVGLPRSVLDRCALRSDARSARQD